VQAAPLPPPLDASDVRNSRAVRRTPRTANPYAGIGYGIGIKNVGFSEGFDDSSTARVRIEPGER